MRHGTYSVSNFPSASLGGDLFHLTLQDKDRKEEMSEVNLLLDSQNDIVVADLAKKSPLVQS